MRIILLIILMVFQVKDINAQVSAAGLTYYTYAGTGATPNYTNLTYPTVLSTGTLTNFNFNWGGGQVLNSGRSEQVIVKLVGYINIPTAGTYYFGGNADDGIVIKVNNTSVVNSWREDGGTFRSGSINLSAGVVPIEVWYYENGGGALFNLQWYMNNTWQILPSSVVATSTTYWAPPPPVVTITTTQQNKINSARARQTYKNEVNIEQIGSYNNVDVVQSGFYHLVDVSVTGDSNNVNIGQSGLKNYAKVGIQGSGNYVNAQQSNTGVSPGHFSEMLISGNNNTIINSQSGDSEKQNFITIDGSSNSINNNQSGTGAKYSDIKLTGSGHTVALDQKDGGQHKARIEATNNGGASNINVLQQGNTSQTYSIQQSCATIGGCSVTVTQQ